MNASPEDQWATYDSRLDAYNTAMAEYDAAAPVWKAYDDACAAIKAQNSQIPAENQRIDEQISATGEELAALQTLFNFQGTFHSINFDGAITTGELLDMARAEADTFPLFLSQDVINAAKYFSQHMDQFAEISGNGNLSPQDAADGLSQLRQRYESLPSQKKTPQEMPPPPDGTRPTRPRKPTQPHVPRPNGSGAKGGTDTTGGTKGGTDTTGGTKGGSGTTDGTTGGSAGGGGSTTATDTDNGPKIDYSWKSGEGGLEGAMTHAQDRMDQIQDRLAWVEDEIGRLESTPNLSPEDKKKLSGLRSEKLKLTRAMQAATEAYQAMMTLLTNMMKMFADIQKQIIGNMR